MEDKIQVTIDVIVHATEDITKFFNIFDELFEIKREKFFIQNLKGHFDNAITTLQVKLTKKDAKKFVDNLVSNLTNEQRRELLQSLEERIHNSAFHLRLNKQKLILRQLELGEKDPVKVKIFTPIYKKTDSTKIYSTLLKLAN